MDNSKMINKLKKFISKYTDTPIEKGFGLSTDSSFQVKNLPPEIKQHKPISELSAKYELHGDVGQFEIIGFVKSGKDTVNYSLRHVGTGESFSLPINLFKLLFTKSENRS